MPRSAARDRAVSFRYADAVVGEEVEVDERDWPIVRIVFPARLGPQTLPRYIAQLESLARRQIPYWALVDVCQLQFAKVKPSHRTELADAADGLIRRYPGIVRCEAVFSDSAAVRMMHTAHVWLRRELPYPSRIFASEREALDWIAELRNG